MTITSNDLFGKKNRELFEKLGNIARFCDFNMIPVNLRPGEGEYDADYLEWHGHPEVCATKGKLAGVLIDVGIMALIDCEQKKVVDVRRTGIILGGYSLDRERNEKRITQIMELYAILESEIQKMRESNGI